MAASSTEQGRGAEVIGAPTLHKPIQPLPGPCFLSLDCGALLGHHDH